MKAKHGAAFRCVLVSLLTGCPMPPSGDDEVGATESSDSSATNVDTTETTDDGGCPVGVEGCPCTDVSSCFPSLECVDDVCVPADPCPVGESGCPCTNFGTCDPGSTCEAGVCQCEAGDLGCECLDDGCSNALDCVDGICSIPELVSEAANGWGPVACWGYRGGIGPNVCTAHRGDVVFPSVISACQVAERLSSHEWIRGDEWVSTGGVLNECMIGLPIPAPENPWSDVGCFFNADGFQGCWGRIGHLWTRVESGCGVPPDDFPPWVPAQDMAYGCETPSPSPVANDVEAWLCGVWPDPEYMATFCRARLGNLWVEPFPPCWETDHLPKYYVPVDWSPFDCTSAQEP
jgi:hypothetical protein